MATEKDVEPVAGEKPRLLLVIPLLALSLTCIIYFFRVNNQFRAQYDYLTQPAASPVRAGDSARGAPNSESSGGSLNGSELGQSSSSASVTGREPAQVRGKLHPQEPAPPEQTSTLRPIQEEGDR
jgi:hypothetical protein